MRLESFLEAKSELLSTAVAKMPVVLTTRVRLARNLAGHRFPGWAREAEKRQVLERCLSAASGLTQLKKGVSVPLEELGELERQLLFERHLISRELMHSKSGSGVVISRDHSCAVMVNEEDHLRIQVLRAGFSLKKIWNAITAMDTALEEALDYAYAPDLGYLTACPSNVGTGLRASAMMHLPALVLIGQMEKVVHAVNQLGIVVRGLFGEGSDASGSLFQISNQTTLGESEEDIIKRLTTVLNTIVEQELNARSKMMQDEPAKILDRIGRSFGIMQNAHILTSQDAMNQLSLLRLGIDLGLWPDDHRGAVDRLFIECQPGHVQHRHRSDAEPAQRDQLRARFLRTELAAFARPTLPDIVGS